ncbi:MAG: HK97 gp10 family phage protein [Muribaculaceae bacterium]|nr:HK97 gp10 family phage protein [Muribaculaceae bacterium]
MFDEFRKDLEKYSKKTPAIFERVAKKGAVHFVNTAKEITDREKLVDTSYYRRNWFADATTSGNINLIYCENAVNYASHLEYGHKLQNGKRVKGKFVGQQAFDEARYYCVQQLQKALDSLMK